MRETIACMKQLEYALYALSVFKFFVNTKPLSVQ